MFRRSCSVIFFLWLQLLPSCVSSFASTMRAFQLLRRVGQRSKPWRISRSGQVLFFQKPAGSASFPSFRGGFSNFSSTTTSGTDTGDRQENRSEYEEWVRRLYMTNMNNPVKLGLENIDRLHSLLGSPMDDVRPESYVILIVYGCQNLLTKCL